MSFETCCLAPNLSRDQIEHICFDWLNNIKLAAILGEDTGLNPFYI